MADAAVTIKAIVDTSGIRQGLDDVQRQADAAPVRVKTELAGSFGGEGPRGTGVPNVTTLTGTTTAPLLPPSQAVAQVAATARAMAPDPYGVAAGTGYFGMAAGAAGATSELARQPGQPFYPGGSFYDLATPARRVPPAFDPANAPTPGRGASADPYGLAPAGGYQRPGSDVYALGEALSGRGAVPLAEDRTPADPYGVSPRGSRRPAGVPVAEPAAAAVLPYGTSPVTRSPDLPDWAARREQENFGGPDVDLADVEALEPRGPAKESAAPRGRGGRQDEFGVRALYAAHIAYAYANQTAHAYNAYQEASFRQFQAPTLAAYYRAKGGEITALEQVPGFAIAGTILDVLGSDAGPAHMRRELESLASADDARRSTAGAYIDAREQGVLEGAYGDGGGAGRQRLRRAGVVTQGDAEATRAQVQLRDLQSAFNQQFGGREQLTEQEGRQRATQQSLIDAAEASVVTAKSRAAFNVRTFDEARAEELTFRHADQRGEIDVAGLRAGGQDLRAAVTARENRGLSEYRRLGDDRAGQILAIQSANADVAAIKAEAERSTGLANRRDVGAAGVTTAAERADHAAALADLGFDARKAGLARIQGGRDVELRQLQRAERDELDAITDPDVRAKRYDAIDDRYAAQRSRVRAEAEDRSLVFAGRFDRQNDLQVRSLRDRADVAELRADRRPYSAEALGIGNETREAVAALDPGDPRRADKRSALLRAGIANLATYQQDLQLGGQPGEVSSRSAPPGAGGTGLEDVVTAVGKVEAELKDLNRLLSGGE